MNYFKDKRDLAMKDLPSNTRQGGYTAGSASNGGAKVNKPSYN